MAGKICSFVFAAVYLCLPNWQVTADEDLQNSKMALIAGETMGTTYHIKLQVKDDQGKAIVNVDSLKVKIDQRLNDINQSMSTYQDDSEISKFNRQGKDHPQRVSRDFATVAQRALQLHELTGGRFDVTVGPLVRFWGFGGGDARSKIPTDKEIEEVLTRVGSNNLKLETHYDVNDVLEVGSFAKSVEGLEVDFSAIAKGFAVDEVAKLVSQFSQNYMVEIGGEVRTRGQNLDSGQTWAIGIELPSGTPLEVADNMAARVVLDGLSLATSGDYRNVVVIEDQEFQHTINPLTGKPVKNGIHSVSVVGTDCMTADGLATGLMVHTLDEIKAFCEMNATAVFVIYEDETGVLKWWASESFDGQVLMADGITVKQKTKSKSSNPLYMILGTIIVFGLAISGMAIGVIMSNRQLKGSCGGLSAMNEGSDGDGPASPCSLCTKPASECSRRSEEATEEVPAE